MAINTTYNGISLIVNEQGDNAPWGIDQTPVILALLQGSLVKNGTNFSLTAEGNFGTAFGIAALYLKSTTALPATTGQIRLANTDSIDWRNAANNANLPLSVDSSNNLLWNGDIIATASGSPVLSITGTANEIIVSNPTGDVTLSTPQAIAVTSSPTFAALTLSSALPVTSGGTGATTSTGTGSVVLSNSPTLVTPDLGTPSALVGTNISGTLTSITLVTPALGTPASGVMTNVTGTAAGLTAGTVTTNANLTGGVTSVGNATTVVTNANLTGVVTSVGNATSFASTTGSGAVVLATSPTLTTPNLGTPSAIVLTNASGTVTNLTLVTPALGTPTALVLTNATGLPLGSTGVTGVLTVPNGGTGDSSFTAYAPLAGGTTTTGAVQSLSTGMSNSGYVLTSTGSGSAPTFQAVSGSGTVNSGTQYQMAYYATTGTAVSGDSGITTDASGALNVSNGTAFDTMNLTGTAANGAGARLQMFSTGGLNYSASILLDARVGQSESLLISTTAPGGVQIQGTALNDNAAAGNVGEYVSAVVNGVTFPTTVTWGDATSISLTAGDWDVTVSCNAYANGATVLSASAGASATSGNVIPGTPEGDKYSISGMPFSDTQEPLIVCPNIRFSLSTTTIVYLKYESSYTVATPRLYGRISARRMR